MKYRPSLQLQEAEATATEIGEKAVPGDGWPLTLEQWKEVETNLRKDGFNEEADK